MAAASLDWRGVGLGRHELDVVLREDCRLPGMAWVRRGFVVRERAAVEAGDWSQWIRSDQNVGCCRDWVLCDERFPRYDNLQLLMIRSSERWFLAVSFAICGQTGSRGRLWAL